MFVKQDIQSALQFQSPATLNFESQESLKLASAANSGGRNNAHA